MRRLNILIWPFVPLIVPFSASAQRTKVPACDQGWRDFLRRLWKDIRRLSEKGFLPGAGSGNSDSRAERKLNSVRQAKDRRGLLGIGSGRVTSRAVSASFSNATLPFGPLSDWPVNVMM